MQMCTECKSEPCAFRCPNRDEPEYTCLQCGETLPECWMSEWIENVCEDCEKRYIRKIYTAERGKNYIRNHQGFFPWLVEQIGDETESMQTVIMRAMLISDVRDTFWYGEQILQFCIENYRDFYREVKNEII